MNAATALQAAVFERLANYAPLVALVARRPDDPAKPGIYDDVPQGAEFDYVTIGEDTLVEWDTDTELGAEATVTVHTWSRERGRKKTKTMQGAIYDALHRFPLQVHGYHTVDCFWEQSESFLDPDGHTRHGVMRFRVTLERL